MTWEQRLHQVEQVVCPEDGGESPFGWREPDTTVTGGNLPSPPRPNRATRRAVARQQRRAGRARGETPCRRYDGQPHEPHPWRGFVGPSAWCPGIPAR